MSFKNMENKFKGVVENINENKFPVSKNKEGKKSSYTFSLSEEKHDYFVREAEKRGFKNKSEFLAEIINQMQE